MTIVWLERATRDIEEAYEYILLDNPQAAEKEVATIIATVTLLHDNPALGKAGRVAGTRELVVAGTPYIAIYRVKDDLLQILRIMHGSRQWPVGKKK